MTNKPWTRDEHILAFDLYVREPSARGNKNHPEVIELSKLLNRLSIHDKSDREPHFRNPDGVGMKLANFLRFDRDYHGKGLSRGNKLEKEIWEEFGSDPYRLARVAEAIRQAVDHEELAATPQLADDEIEASEGRTLSRIHRYRERNRDLSSKKKQSVIRNTGRLECEVCGFEFGEFYGPVGHGFAECHHIVPVSELKPGQKTRLSDLAIVCANCHRVIHRQRPWLSIPELREIISRSPTDSATLPIR